MSSYEQEVLDAMETVETASEEYIETLQHHIDELNSLVAAMQEITLNSDVYALMSIRAGIHALTDMATMRLEKLGEDI